MGVPIIDKHSGWRGRRVEPARPAPAAADPASAIVREAVGRTERARLSFAQDLEGPEAERITTTSLAILGRYGWVVVDVTGHPEFPELAEVHIVVGPAGVVLVAEKPWTGHVAVDRGVLRHSGYRCEEHIEALIEACGSVQALLSPEHRSAVAGVLHVTPRDMEPTVVSGLHVVGRLHLASLLVDLPQRLTPLDVADIHRELTRLLATPPSPLVASGGAALSGGTVFYPTASSGPETASYFVPRQPTPAPSAPAAGEPPIPPFPLNRFGIR